MNQFDILLVQTRFFDPMAWLIRKYTHSKWNHCCFILNEHEVIDCKSIGIKIRPLKKYLNKLFYKTKLMRLEGLTQQDKANLYYYISILAPALKTNYFRFLLTLYLIYTQNDKLLPAFTCSGFVATCLSLATGIAVKLGKMDGRITPEDINSNSNFKEVKL